MIKSKLISDIILRITKGKPSDDLELEPRQVAFWINIVRDELVKEYLDSKAEKGVSVDDFFVKREPCKPLVSEDFIDIPDTEERLYVCLKFPPIEVYGDRGIVRITTSEGSMIKKARLSSIDFIKKMEFSKPTENNLVYYRDGKTKIIIEGIPLALKDLFTIYVWYVPQENIEDLSDTDEVNIPNELIPELQRRVEDIARRQMFGFSDNENNGKDDLPNQVNG